jgi:hypothetical protein
MKYAFRVPNAASSRVIPIVDGEAARTQLSAAKAKADGFTILAWPEDPAGPVAAVDLPDYIPAAPDPAVAARAARLEAIASAPEAANVSPDVLDTLAARDMPLADARGLLRGLSRRAISNQFRVELDDEPMTESAPAAPDDPRAARMKELRANVAPTKATRAAAQLIAADTDAKRARLLEIKIGGIMSRAERGDRAAIAKRKEIRAAEVLARANNLSLVHALAVAGVTL